MWWFWSLLTSMHQDNLQWKSDPTSIFNRLRKVQFYTSRSPQAMHLTISMTPLQGLLSTTATVFASPQDVAAQGMDIGQDAHLNLTLFKDASCCSLSLTFGLSELGYTGWLCMVRIAFTEPVLSCFVNRDLETFPTCLSSRSTKYIFITLPTVSR